MFMGASNPKAVKEVLVYPIDAPANIDNFVNPGNRVPSWQSRPVCPQVEYLEITLQLASICKLRS